MQRAYIDCFCIEINSDHYAEYSRPTMLQVKQSEAGQGGKKKKNLSWRTVNSVASLPSLVHFKSITRQKASSFQYVDLREVTHNQCRKMHIFEVRVRMRMFYI